LRRQLRRVGTAGRVARRLSGLLVELLEYAPTVVFSTHSSTAGARASDMQRLAAPCPFQHEGANPQAMPLDILRRSRCCRCLRNHHFIEQKSAVS
jgi:hypothetical protein